MLPALKGSELDEIDTSWNVGLAEMNGHSWKPGSTRDREINSHQAILPMTGPQVKVLKQCVSKLPTYKNHLWLFSYKYSFKRPSLRRKLVLWTSNSGKYDSQSLWESLMKNMNENQGRKCPQKHRLSLIPHAFHLASSMWFQDPGTSIKVLKITQPGKIKACKDLPLGCSVLSPQVVGWCV